mmetsp:Transcript_8785/g.18006  ORF Transcript_8785/g.18006 Transcript_8785/m.18006 type:complete len:358 (-) Transcript_8785:99-1172(-)
MNFSRSSSNHFPTRRGLRDVTNSLNNDGASVRDKKKEKFNHSLRSSASAAYREKPKNEKRINERNINAKLPSSIESNLLSNPVSYQYSGHSDDIDKRDQDDPLCATEYVEDMYEYFRSNEGSTSVQPTYMTSQRHINEKMRAILVDWLVEVHLKFKLVPETLYLCINLIDRFLKDREVSRQKLQLVGVTCLLIASKYEEIYPPELRDLVYICDSAYTKDEILDMEETILKGLKYQITIPSAHAFLVRYLKAAHADKKMVQISCYFLDGTLQSYDLLRYLPSELAAASILLARRIVGRNVWSPTLLKYAQYREESVVPIAREILAEKSASNAELKAVTKKYNSNRYGAVASISMPIDF